MKNKSDLKSFPDEDFMALLSQVYQEAAPADDCSFSQKTIAYALGELGYKKREEIRKHLVKCRSCLELYFDVRTAETESSDSHLLIWYTIKNRAARISEMISPFITPRLVSAMAAACLVILVTISGLYVRISQSPISVNIKLIGNAVETSDRIKGEALLPKEFELEQGGILRSGTYFRIKVSTDRDAYAYVLLYDASQEISKLFSGKVCTEKTLLLPSADKPYELDDNTGTESIYVIVSEEAADGFDSKLAELKNVGISEIKRLFPKSVIRTFSFRHE